MIQQYQPAQLPSPPFEVYAPWVQPTLTNVLTWMIPVVVLCGVIGCVALAIKGMSGKK